MKKFLARYLSDQHDIEDVAQEAYLRAYTTEQQKEIEWPKALLFSIAKNLALTELNKKSRQITDYIADLDASEVLQIEASAEDEVEGREQLGIYCEAVAALPVTCRRIFLLRKIHGLSHKEIAERVGLSVSSVEKYLRRAILQCEKYIYQREDVQANLIYKGKSSR